MTLLRSRPRRFSILDSSPETVANASPGVSYFAQPRNPSQNLPGLGTSYSKLPSGIHPDRLTAGRVSH